MRSVRLLFIALILTSFLMNAPHAVSLDSWESCCGAVVIRITAEMLGHTVKLGRVRQMLRTRDGGLSSMADLKETLTELGFFATGYEMTGEQIERCTLPMIVHDPPEHFVVCLGLGKTNGVLWVDAPEPAKTLVSTEVARQKWKVLVVSNNPISALPTDDLLLEGATENLGKERTIPKSPVTIVDPVWELGTVTEGKRFTHKYSLTNGSPTAITLAKVVSSCSCVSVKDFRSIRLMPGCGAELEVEFDTDDQSGRVQFALFVHMSDEAGVSYDPVPLTIKATVSKVGRLLCTPHFLDLGAVYSAEVLSRDIIVRRTGYLGLGNMSFLPSNESISAKQLSRLNDSIVLVRVNVTAPATKGSFAYNLTMKSSQEKSKPYEFKVRGHVRSRVEIEPKRFFLGEIDATAGVSRVFKVTHRQTAAVTVEEMSVSSEVLRVSQETSAGGPEVCVYSVARLKEGPLLVDVTLGLLTPDGAETIDFRISGVVVDASKSHN